MKIRYDLTTETVVLETDYSHRVFSVRRAFVCPDCGKVHKNHLVEALRAIALYEKAPKEKDVSAAILAYDLEEILKALDANSVPAKKYSPRGKRMPIGDGTGSIKRLERKTELTMDLIGDLDDL